MSTWIWPALHCQVCIPALSKLLGGQKGNPHTEAFHSRDLACPSVSGCLKWLLGSFCCNPLDWAPTACQTYYPALVHSSLPPSFPHIWMRQVFPKHLGTKVRIRRQSARGHRAVRTGLAGSPSLLPASPRSSRSSRSAHELGVAVTEGPWRQKGCSEAAPLQSGADLGQLSPPQFSKSVQWRGENAGHQEPGRGFWSWAGSASGEPGLE